MQATKRTILIATGLLILSTLLSACGGAGGGSQPTATYGPAVQTRLAESQRPLTTSTPTAEAAAQAASPTPLPTQEPAIPEPSATALVEPEPDPATDALLLSLLTLDDMPEGWQGGEPIEDEGSSNWTGDDDMFAAPTQADECGYGFDDPNLNEVSAYFGDSVDEFIVLHMVSLYANAQSAELFVDQMFGAMERCPEVEDSYDASVITRFTVLEDPLLGDQSGRFIMGGSGDGFNTAIAVTAFRVGPVLSFVFLFGSTELSGPVETWNLNDLAIRSVEKLIPLRETFDAFETPPENVV